jgi:hypothetical protein
MALKIKKGKPRPPAKDRRISLVVIGILDILGGLLLALMAPMMVFTHRAAPATTVPTAHPLTLGTTVGTCALFLVLATLAIWGGIGLCLCRRWARSLTLVAHWMVLICGLAGVFTLALIMPDILTRASENPGLSTEAVTMIKWTIIIMMTIIFIVIPGIHVIVLSHANVRDTCQYRDPRTRWTDAVPLPILILTLYKALGALSMLSIVARQVAPFFGLVLTGMPAMAVALGGAAALAWVAREIYFLRIRGWWGSLAMTAGWGLSYAITLSRHGLLEMSGSATMSPEELATFSRSPIFQGNCFAYTMAAVVMISISYLIFCKRYFLVKKRASRRPA